MTSLYSDLNVRKLESRATTLSLLQALAEGELQGLLHNWACIELGFIVCS